MAKVPEVYINRIQETDQGTLGLFSVPALYFYCYSLELPNRDNKRNYSRVNPKRYLCKWTQSPKYGFVPLLQDVDGRSGVLMHSLNYAGDALKKWLTHSQGCIGLGDKAGQLGNQLAVLNSKSTHLQFEKLMKKQDFYLTIK